ncbi:response regulator [Halobacteriovorax sp. JY17]|uniref:response regulator n=1 Tax=Halobacteriovorax sp. JY17 TaxID=2014617 RepID=UPI000C679B75|nr:response regulator [Halobacteriovorax sp. JY17]PIK16373.1 MAG: hypothetical protein CES88_06420 [Halobacteriovorax sp. JY17]
MQELRVLVADDSEDFFSLLKERIGVLRYDVNFMYAKNGYEALNFLRNERVQLLITDFYMPVINGVELIKSLKTLDEAFRPKEVVVLSAYLESGTPTKDLEFVKFLPKDDYYSDLVHIISDLAESLDEFEGDEDTYLRNVRVDIIGKKFVDIVHAMELDIRSVTVHDPHLIFECEKDEVVDCIITLPSKNRVKTKGRVKRLLGASEKNFKIEFFDLNLENQAKLENFLRKEVAA